ncbi:SH3 domain-containing protein 19 isoform X2 [Kryptolebias marmoratus]|uniref:SH3 domain-containing protein 19 isoform X2 n=1 Tax=Kryptolebias marmoratus TaxID=37003 RepID=UPI0007F93CD7|nr:SH3 domain-containing protein 19 isoform X2 [Kryptolebias marmoratus]
MMAEDRKDQNLWDRSQTTDPAERTKLEHFHVSQKPLSSLQTATKRTRTNSQDNSRRERRRPDITVVSGGPLGRSSLFSGGSGVFPPQSSWSAGIQTISQVIQEKTQEAHIVKPTAAPRQSTSCTQTGAVGKETVSRCGETPPTERSPAGKKPLKPPRPLLPKAAERKPVRLVKTQTKTSVRIPEGQSDSKSDVKELERADSSHTCTRSVTVHWNIPTSRCSVTAAATETTSSNSANSQPPIPRPRTKLRKFAKEEEPEVQTLVKFDENCEILQSDSQEVSTNRYLKELLEVFSESNVCERSTHTVDQSDENSQDEDTVGEMSNNHSQQSFRARIQAFESQAGAEGGNEPSLPPRRASYKPSVAARPPAAFKAQSVDDASLNAPAAQNPFTSPRPPPSSKPVGQSIREELEALHSKGNTPHRSRPPVLARSDSVEEEEEPMPSEKPFREPLKPNLNINNHNSASMFTDDEHGNNTFNNIPVKPQYSMDGSGNFTNKPSVGKRPTTIRVPSKTGSNNFQDSVPTLPARNPVGSVNTPGSNKQGIKHSLSLQNSYNFGPQPSLPPRNPSMNKSLPPRPPPAKTGPGRPLPPNLQAVGRSQSTPQQASPKYLSQKPSKKGLLLPPRPSPGHRLYNKYILPLPHGIATSDFDGSNTGELSLQKNEVLLLLEEINRSEFECQVGEDRGRVKKSRMTVITPLESDDYSSQDAGATASGGDGSGLKVQALYDFFPESSEELTFREGDVVTEVEQMDNQWYRGTLNGSTGFFPINYVEVLSSSPKVLPEKKKPKPKSAPVSGPRCEARFDFEGEHSDELSFSEGDVIQLKAYVGEDWVRGQIGHSVGIFPLNFVDVIEDLPPPPSQQQSGRVALPGMAAPEAAKPAQAPKSSVEWAVALYDYTAKSDDEVSFQQGDRILVTKHLNEDWSSGRLNSREGMFPRAFIETNTGETTNQQDGRRARALYSFESNCDEELTFQVGDIITNLESIDDEWFLGELGENRALVPKNYVQVLE